MSRLRRPLGRLAVLVGAAGLVACGGGGGDASSEGAGAATTTTDYPHSVVLGLTGEQTLDYSPGLGTNAATVEASTGSALLPAGATPLVAEHTEPTLPGVRVACVSGHGDSTNVITGINDGVIAQSAAVLFDARWVSVDTATAFAAVAASGKTLVGWENCGVKPEGPPSPSSRLTPQRSGGYVEDVYDGNPSTTFNVIRRDVTAAELMGLLSAQGFLTSEDPLRPLRVTLQAHEDDAGRTVFVEIGTPAATAPAATRGFIALYVPAS